MLLCRVVLCLLFGAASAVPSAQVLVVETIPTGAEVVVDGRSIGTSPAVAAAAPGDRRVRASLPRYVTAESTVVAVVADTVRITLRLTPAPGAVRVVGLPADATAETTGWTLTGDVSQVAPGISTIRVRLPGQPDLFARIPVEPEAETVVEFVDEFSTRGFAGNLVLPGSSQLGRGRPVVGLGYALGTVATLGSAFGAHLRVRSADADLRTATGAYQRARSEAEVAAAYDTIDAAHDRGRSARRFRTGAAAAAAAVYVTSLLDAAFHYGRQPALRVGPPVPAASWSLHPTDQGVAARLTF